MVKRLEEYIKMNHDKVIAIDGPSGAGKSSLAQRLEATFDVLVIHTDDYFLPLSMKTPDRLMEPGGNIDYERLEKEVFSCLNDAMIKTRSFNCQSNELEPSKNIKKKSIIIVEGVYSLHPNFIKYYDLTVFLNIDRKTQLRRIFDRSGEKLFTRFVEEWIPLEDKYFDEFELKNNVDLYIDNY